MLTPQSQCAELTIKQRKLSVEPTGVLHCLSSVTALKGEHATHCGEPDCSGVIDQLPGVIPRYRAAETNAGKNTRNLLSPLSSRRQGESSPFPQAKTLNAGRDAAVIYFFFPLVQIYVLNQAAVTDVDLGKTNIKSIPRWASKEIQFKMETGANGDHNRHKILLIED